MKKKILFIATFPPPIHGSAVMSQYIKDSKLINDTFDCDYINLSTSRNIDEIGKSHLIKLWRLLAALISLLCKLMSRRYDLCYLAITCHGVGFLKDVPFVLLCKMFNKRIVIHQHNKGMSKDVDRWPYNRLLPLTYENVKVILLSHRLYPDIEKVVPKKNVYICPNGIPNDTSIEKIREENIPHLLFLSNLMVSKGVFVLLDALKIVSDRGVDFRCDIVGSESKEISRQRLSDEIIIRGLRSKITYHGRKTGEEKKQRLMNADVLIHPTLDDCFPLVLIEAMQYGLPIVTTDEGGIPDMVENGNNGLICEKNNPESLALCLEYLLNDESIRKRMGESGYEKYRNEYTLEGFEKKLISILKSCCCESI